MTTPRHAARALAWPLLLLGGLSACSFSTYGTARPVDEGTTQFFVAPAVTRMARGGKPLVTPQLEMGARHGLSEDLEVGAKLWLPGVAADLKVRLLDGTDPDGMGFDLSLNPSFSWLGGLAGSDYEEGNTLHIVTVTLPVLMGWDVGQGHQLVIGPRVVEQVWTGTGTTDLTANIVYVGTSVGFAWKASDDLRIIPEVSVVAPVVQSLSDFGTDFGLGGTGLQFGVAFAFGGDAPPPPSVPRCEPEPRPAAAEPPPNASP